METFESSPLNAIDFAITACENKIELHRKEAKGLFRTMIVTLLFLGGLVVVLFYSSAYNQSAVASFTNELAIQSKEIEANITKNQFLIDEINDFNQNLFRDTVRGKELGRLIKVYLKEYDSTTTNIKRLPYYFQSSLIKIDSSTTYILYAIFILVFGILTSFYRFHLKEVSKYEHFLFGFQRIRIAGNNSSTKYDDEVKTSLAKDAFTQEQKNILSKAKRVESPIPGHPGADAATFLLNKILSAIDISVKSKDK